MEPKMKLSVLFIVLLAELAWPQVEAGTVLYSNISQNELTVAADSRTVFDIGKYEDTECKISAFGSQFVFAMAGIARRDSENVIQWDAHSVARGIWKREAKIDPADNLVTRVADDWVVEMAKLYSDPWVAQVVSKRNADGTFANALFAATGKSGKLTVEAIDIGFDRPLFNLTHEIRVTHDSVVMREGDSVFGGYDRTANEFARESTQRARDYMNWFKTRISGMGRSTQRAELASKFVELSILLDADNSELGFPVDVLQLRGGGTVRWRWVKPNCPLK
jgi:hypothetical protein